MVQDFAHCSPPREKLRFSRPLFLYSTAYPEAELRGICRINHKCVLRIFTNKKRIVPILEQGVFEIISGKISD